MTSVPETALAAGAADRMKLGLRARPLTVDETKLFHDAQRRHLKIVLLVPLIVAGGLLLGRVSLGVALPIATILALAWAAYLYVQRLPIRRSILLLPVILLGTRAFALFLESRLVATVSLAAMAVVLCRLYGDRPLRFYQEWLLTDARLRTETRSAMRLLPLRPNLGLLAGMLALMIIIPWRHSTTLAVLTAVVIPLAFIALLACSSERPLPQALIALFHRAKWMNHLYLAYPDQLSAAPGQWTPDESLATRRRNYLFLTVPLYLTIIVALSFCCPWEIFASWFVPGFEWSIPPSTGQRAYDWMLLR